MKGQEVTVRRCISGLGGSRGGRSVHIKKIGEIRTRGMIVKLGSWGAWQTEGPGRVGSRVLGAWKIVAIGSRGLRLLS